MKDYNCLIVDDEPMAIKVLESYINKLEFIRIEATCKNALEALNILSTKKIDIVFLDINMPKLSGLNMLKMLSNKPSVIITTAYKEFAIEGFELDVTDYLLKPISFERFMKAVNKAVGSISVISKFVDRKSEKGGSDQIFIKSDKLMKKVKLSDILYIEGLKDYIQIILKNENIVSNLSLKYMEAKLPEHLFMRTHKSFIASIENITSYTANEINIGTHYIPIGRYYKKMVLDILDKQLF